MFVPHHFLKNPRQKPINTKVTVYEPPIKNIFLTTDSDTYTFHVDRRNIKSR